MFTIEQVIVCDTRTLWKYLTDSSLVRLWMSESPDFAVHSDWRADAPIRIEATVNGSRHINEGTITRFEPEKSLRYEYVNSVSAAHYGFRKTDKVEFALKPVHNGTLLTLSCSTRYGEVEEKHLKLYWSATLTILKNMVENHSRG